MAEVVSADLATSPPPQAFRTIFDDDHPEAPPNSGKIAADETAARPRRALTALNRLNRS